MTVFISKVLQQKKLIKIYISDNEKSSLHEFLFLAAKNKNLNNKLLYYLYIYICYRKYCAINLNT